MPLTVFLGDTRGETHTTTHPDGTVTTTRVVRDPEWTDTDREAAWTWWEDQQDRCPVHGGPRSECDTPQTLFPQRSVCFRAAVQQAAERLREQHTRDRAADEQGFKETDGEWIWVSDIDLNPDDDFLGLGARATALDQEQEVSGGDQA